MHATEPKLLPIRRGAKTRYLTALAVVAFVAVAQFLFLENRITDQRKQTHVVGIAGRQRVLAAEISDLAGQLVAAADGGARREYRGWLREDLDELAKNQGRLEDGTDPINPGNWPPLEARRLFGGGAYDVTRSTREFVRRGLSLAAAPSIRLTPVNGDLFYVRDMSGGLGYAYDTVVRAYIASSDRRDDDLLLYEALGLAALLLTLALEVPLIFVPMQRDVVDSYRRLVLEANALDRAQRTARLGFWERNLSTGEGIWSEQLREMAGVTKGEAPPPFSACNHPDDAAAVDAAVGRARRDHTSYSIEHRVLTPAGDMLWVRHQGQFEYGPDGTAVSLFGTALDITERKIAEERAKHAAYFDAATGLPNRLLLEDRVQQALASARRSGSIVALLAINLNRFKIITDSLGHAVGDQTLRAVAARLTGLLRESDTVARVGGNEFAIVLRELTDGASAGAVADKVIAACTLPYTIDGEEVYATVSIGIGLYPLDATDVEALVRTADLAMFKAMQYPAGNYQINSPEAHVGSSSRLGLERELRRALERDELVVHYQPIVGNSRRAVGVEALVRWQHPERGLLGPDVFLPLAEEIGLIIPIGDWVLRTACARAKLWQRFALPEFRLAVNISPVQFGSGKFHDGVRGALAASGLEPSVLELEITESVVMQDVGRAIDSMRTLKAMGIALSIDDFGTGYSSLSYLKQFPIDTLKIDRSFVGQLPANREDAAIVEAIVTLARNLGLRVVAEGVETREQVAYLRTLQVDELQGYYFSRPLPADAVERWILADIEPVGTNTF